MLNKYEEKYGRIGIWVDAAGEEIYILNMSINYINNCIGFLEKRRDILKKSKNVDKKEEIRAINNKIKEFKYIKKHY